MPDAPTTPVRSAAARRAETVAALASLVVDTLRLRVDPDEIDPDAPLFGAGLQLDSIDSVELVVAIEERFGVTLVDRDRGDPSVLRTLNTIADQLDGGARPAPSGAPRPEAADVHLLRRAVALSTPSSTLVRVDGDGAAAALDALLPCDVWLRDGQARPTVLLDVDGTVQADVVLLCDGDAFQLLADGVDAGTLAALLPGADVTDLGPTHALIGLDGPFAWELLAAWDEPGVVGLPYLSFYDRDDTRVLRAGRTGEYGYTLIVPRERAAAELDRLLALGARYGTRVVTADTLAYGALETGFVDAARLPVRLDPRELQLQWRMVRYKAARGIDGLAARPWTRRTAAFRGGPGVVAGADVSADGEVVGTVLVAAPDPGGPGTVGLLLLPRDLAGSGLDLAVGDEAVRTVSLPLVAHRSLYVRPQRHTWADADTLPFPYGP